MDRPPLLFRVLHAEKARSTHHKLALDALLHLRSGDAERWRNLFLRHVEPFLTGAKAPDKTFKDFVNHVLHVRDGLWGGAPKKTREWYGTLVERLSARDWAGAAYAAGVLSHYYSDPLMPFHTAQSDREKIIHRAGEWSCTKSYDRFRELLDTSLGWPDVPVPAGGDWLEKMTVAGAVRSHGFYDEFCDRYDHAAGVKNPPAGLDDRCREELALCVGHAAVGFSRILDKAIEEAGVTPPRYGVSVVGFLTAFTKPILWLTKRLADAGDRREVLRIWKELQKTGGVEKTLPLEQRTVREARAKAEGGRKKAEGARPAAAPRAQPAPARPRMIAAVPAGAAPAKQAAPAHQPAAAQRPRARPVNAKPQAAPQPAVKQTPPPSALPLPPSQPTFRLHPADAAVDGPSIGPKTAARLNEVGIHTVADLLAADPHELADRLDARWIVPEVVRDWRDQAALMCRVPNLYGHDAQLLVEIGQTDPAELAAESPAGLMAALTPLLNSKAGERIIRGAAPPDLAEVADWVRWAADARPMPDAAERCAAA